MSDSPSFVIETQSPERLLTTQEVATWLDVHPHTLYQWRRSGRGPRPLRVGSNVRYRASDVEAWLERAVQ